MGGLCNKDQRLRVSSGTEGLLCPRPKTLSPKIKHVAEAAKASSRIAQIGVDKNNEHTRKSEYVFVIGKGALQKYPNSLHIDMLAC